MFQITYVERVQKKKAPVTAEEHSQIKEMLHDAQGKYKDFIPTIELGRTKGSTKIKNQIQYVADQEGIKVRVTRKNTQLFLKFSGKSEAKSTRMSDDAAAEIVLDFMKKDGRIYGRGELAIQLEMTPVKVSRALKLLVAKKKAVSEGTMPKLKYRAK